jgi:hypothetical protein
VETTYSGRSIDILGEQHALRLDDEEVDEFVDVPDQGIEGFTRDRVVLAGAELGREAIVQEGLPGDLGGDGDAKDHPGELENPTHHIEVPNREDEGDNGGVGDGRGT